MPLCAVSAPLPCPGRPAAQCPALQVLIGRAASATQHTCISTSCAPTPQPPHPTPPPRTHTCSFFEDYKKNENKVVVVDEFLGREEALRIIREAMDQYQDLYVPKRQRH